MRVGIIRSDSLANSLKSEETTTTRLDEVFLNLLELQSLILCFLHLLSSLLRIEVGPLCYREQHVCRSPSQHSGDTSAVNDPHPLG